MSSNAERIARVRRRILARGKRGEYRRFAYRMLASSSQSPGLWALAIGGLQNADTEEKETACYVD